MVKTCRQCAQQFEVTDEDLKFYDKVSPVFAGKKYELPPPTLCPSCRQQRRLAFRNERKLYHRKCDSCKKEMVSMYSPDKSYIVYCNKCWWSDQYDPTKYGRDFDFNKPVFEQIADLFAKAPLQTLISSPDAEENNCSYINFAGNSKNCYMVFDSDFNEDSYYSNVLKHSENCLDCSYVQASELCYECLDCTNCYNLSYSQDCNNCTDGYYLKNCIGCSNCAFSSNLTRKEYYIFNKPYSKEEYFKTLQSLQLGKNSLVKEQSNKFQAHKLQFPQKFRHSINTENCSGDYIYDSKNCSDSYNIGQAEDLKYCDSVYKAKDCYDVSSFGEKIEKIYESGTIGINVYDVLFSFNCVENVTGLAYCLHARVSKNCFGGVSLKSNKYCILNKQYTKEEYEALMPRIIEHMKKTGEWGEHFQISMSAFGYNETIASEHFPLPKEQVLKLSGKWKEDEVENRYQGAVFKIPDDIKDVLDDITKQILSCETCEKNYKIIPQELEFYRKKGIPIPKNCFNCRHTARMAMRNPNKLWDRVCAKCSAPVKTSYAPERPETVCCESCYLKEIY